MSWKLMRAPQQGGTPETVLVNMTLGGEFRCALQRNGRCVLRTVESDQFVFNELDPVRGKGRELTRAARSPTVVGDWDISPDGSQLAIPNHDSRDARIRLIPLDPVRAGMVEKTVVLAGLKNLNGVVWAADGRGWYVSIRTDSDGLLKYVDVEGVHISNLRQSPSATYVVPKAFSPARSLTVAALDATLIPLSESRGNAPTS